MIHPPIIRALWAAMLGTLTAVSHAGAQVAPSEQTVPSGWPVVTCGDARGAVWGVAQDQLRLSLAGAQVYVVGTRCGAVTDSLGRIGLLGLDRGDLQLRADLIGYMSDSASIAVGNDAARLDFRLPQPQMDDYLVMFGETGPPWTLSRDLAQEVIGCYEIDAAAPYSNWFEMSGGPWETSPLDYPGVPTVVRLQMFGPRADSVALIGRTIRSADEGDTVASDWIDQSRWRFAVRGDSLVARWTGSPNVWWVRHRLLIHPDSLVGVSRYLSHELGGVGEPMPTVWRRRTTCGS